MTINKQFIDKWKIEYEEEANDYNEYKYLVKSFRVNDNIRKFTGQQIIQLVNWKTHRIKGKMNKNINIYIDKLNSIPKLVHVEDKIKSLVKLDGWHIAMASTALHMMYPDEVPIIDFRVLKVLEKYENFKANRDTINGFMMYYHRINEIKIRTNRTIREIDEALWSYHRIKMQK